MVNHDINNLEIKDVAIIGAGPVGLFAVFECGMLGLSCCVIDSLEELGGQCTALYPEKPIYDIPAHPEILAHELIENLEKQASPFRPEYHLSAQIVSIRKESSFWSLLDQSGNIIQARFIIIAAGSGAFGPNKPPLAGLEAYEGKSVFYMVRKKDDFKDKKIIIAGGGDSAVDWTLALAPIAENITVIHRRDKFRASPESVSQLHNLAHDRKITLMTSYQLDSLCGNDGQLKTVTVKSMQGEYVRIDADILLPFYGLSMNLGPIKDWGLNIENNHIPIDPTTARTNIQKIYAIGDIAAYKNKKKLILTGFSEAAFAAYDIYQELHPDQSLHFEYSTTKGLPV
jgi:thioredoxin reductase (NADPH)